MTLQSEATSAYSLAGKVALVVGAGRGIGAAIARCFARAGAAVGCADLDIGAAANVVTGIAGEGGRGLILACDVARESEVDAMVEQTIERFGRLDALAYTVAIADAGGTVLDYSVERWRQAFAVNVDGAFLCCRAVIPHLRAAGGGSIVLTASNFSATATAERAAYCSTKGAMVQLARSIAVDFAKDNIRANALSPGAVETRRMIDRFGSLDSARRIAGPNRPLGRLGQPEEIAHTALFLASEASSFMTGAELRVDGGITAV